MSRPLRERFVCPKCGHEDEVTIWSSLNNTLSPNEANELLFGNLFGYTCPECGNTTELCYACPHHDMEKHVMVQYVQDASQAEASVAHLDGFLDGGVPHHEMDECGYRYRIVFDHNRLREKARIFHDGLDDRAVEVLKLMAEAMASENIGDMDSVPVYYESIGGDGNLVFALLADKLNSTFIDEWFRGVSGSTQVNARDIKKMPCPTLDELEDPGRSWTAGMAQDQTNKACEVLL